MSNPDPPARPRCPVKGCPVVYRAGPPRLCPGHQYDATDQAVSIAADELGLARPLPVDELSGHEVTRRTR